jgi:hypothetical protein
MLCSSIYAVLQACRDHTLSYTSYKHAFEPLVGVLYSVYEFYAYRIHQLAAPGISRIAVKTASTSRLINHRVRGSYHSLAKSKRLRLQQSRIRKVRCPQKALASQ